MSLPLPFQYKSSGFSEPGIFVELYLAKRTKFQGILYKTLTDGFKIKLVKDHFLKEKKPLIQAVLEHHAQWRKYSKESIQSMEPFYRGYSLYEVDGVFYSEKPRTKNKRHIVEERTQVIRMMFLPDLKKMISQLRLQRMEFRDVVDIIKVYLRISGHKRGEQGANVVEKSIIERITNRNSGDILKHVRNGNVEKIVNYTEKWFDDVGLFLFGYVIFEICSEIKKLGDIKEVDYEEEIWLTSFWNLNVNRVSYRKGPTNR